MILLLLLSCLALAQARPRTVTARPELCIGHKESSKRLARLVSKRPELFFRASRRECWTPRPPRDGDRVVIDFSRSKLAADGRFFTLDEPTVYESVLVRGPRWRHRRALPLHSVVRLTRHVEVVQHVRLPRHGVLFLDGDKARLTTGQLYLRGATLMGSGEVHADQFIATRGSFISPGRTLVSQCGARCFGLPRKLGGVKYGSLKLITHEEADLSGAHIVIKHIGEHVSFGQGPSDFFAANLASPSAGAILILGDSSVKVPEDKEHRGPYDLVQFPASAYPQDPASAICVAAGTGGLDFSPTSEKCRLFMLQQPSPAVFHPNPDTDPIARWMHHVESVKTLAATQNLVPFKVHDCCRQLIRRSFVRRRILESISHHRQLMTKLDQTEFLHQMKVDPVLRAMAPRHIRELAMAVAPTTTPAPLVPNSLKVTKSCFFCYANPDTNPVETKCVASTTIHPSDKCCPPGYMGKGCTEPLSCTCSQHGICEVEGGNCMCDPGFGGFDCSTPICPVSKGVQCTGPAFGRCIATPNDPEAVPKCNCTPGFGGEACEIPVCNEGMCKEGQQCFTNGGPPACWEENPLKVDTCANGGKIGPKGCVCPKNFEGPRCQSPLCPNRCSRSGLCMLEKGNPVCRCAEGFYGHDCSNQLCTANRCANGGVCVLRAGIADCSCPPGFSGPDCRERTMTVNRQAIYAGRALRDGGILLGIMGGTFLVAFLVVGVVYMYSQRKSARAEKDMQRKEMQMIDSSN